MCSCLTLVIVNAQDSPVCAQQEPALASLVHLVVVEALKGSSALSAKSLHAEGLYVLHAQTLSLLPEGSSLSHE